MQVCQDIEQYIAEPRGTLVASENRLTTEGIHIFPWPTQLLMLRTFSFILAFVLANTIIGLPVLTATASDMNANNFEELRDNLVEVRLALQKGDLTEALQHLNNAEEQLLLFEESVTANSTIPQ
jgi:hypothetical protein